MMAYHKGKVSPDIFVRLVTEDEMFVSLVPQILCQTRTSC